ncbi:nucleotidyltransferase family protein [Nocardia vinacea]|uniref:nucleotidyltransferase family protein n=1 Tax=Nocardia vinacea TaxID=96468 RepID=UPI003439274C
MVPTIDQLLHALTRAANTLADAGIRFAVAGGCAVYARGGPASEHDVDIFIKPADLSQARSALARGGLRIAEPPEDWLTKVYDGGVLIDLIYRPNNRAVTDELLDRADMMRVGPTMAPVISASDLMIDKLLVFDAHRLDLSPLLTIARDLREQVDWERVRKETDISPYARAFLGLLDDLGVIEPKRVV